MYCTVRLRRRHPRSCLLLPAGYPKTGIENQWRLEVAFKWNVQVVADKIGLVGRPMHPGFAKHSNMRVFFEQRLVTSVHEIQAIVNIRIDAPGVDPEYFHTPERMFDQEFREVGIVLVEIGHLVREPAVAGDLLIDGAGMRIDQRLIAVVGLGIFRPLVQPVFFGKVLDEEMIKPYMVIDRILDQFHPVPVERVGEPFIQCCASQAGFDRIVIGESIAMFGPLGMSFSSTGSSKAQLRPVAADNPDD